MNPDDPGPAAAAAPPPAVAVAVADTGLAAPARAAAASLATLALLVAGSSLAWFAWVDAPITDGAMGLEAVGVGLAVLGALLALLARERLLGADAATPRALARAARLRRIALALVASGLIALATAALATLNLRGAGTDDDDAQATATVTAWRAYPGVSPRGPRPAAPAPARRAGRSA